MALATIFLFHDAPQAQTTAGFCFVSRPPADCPFDRSTDIKGIWFTGRHAEYTGADTWYLSWADDDNCYSPYMDGSVGGVGQAQSGVAVVKGSDPMKLEFAPIKISPEVDSCRPYYFQGGNRAGWSTSGPPFMVNSCQYWTAYACASIVYKQVWYLAPETRASGHYNGPFVGFRISRNFGATWTNPPLPPTATSLFPEAATCANGKTKIAVPHFVDFGKDMEHSPDGKAYLTAHGSAEGNVSWNLGNEIYLLRTTLNVDSVNNSKAYEFFAGYDTQRNAVWSRNFADIKPMISWKERVGNAAITYNAPLRKYFMVVDFQCGHPAPGCAFDTYILESERVAGPWKLVSYMKGFGPQGYFVNIPSKFISSDGRRMWLCYSANYNYGSSQPNPPGSKYACSFQEIELLSGSQANAPGLTARAVSERRVDLSIDTNGMSSCRPWQYLVYRNGQLLDSTTTLTYSDVGAAEQTAYRYAVRAQTNCSSDMLSERSSEFAIVTPTDTVAPRPVSVYTLGDSTKVFVVFSEEMAQVPAVLAANYTIDNNVTVKSAALDANGTTLTLSTSPLKENVDYTLVFAGLTDRALRPVLIVNGTKSFFRYYKKKPGVVYEYYETDGSQTVAVIDKLRPTAVGVSNGFSLAPRKRETNFAFQFTGFVNVAAEGQYRFYTTSDDGSKLLIGDSVVVENDGSHGMVEKSGTFRLSSGFVPITVRFCQGGSGFGLEVRWEGPGISKQLIPDSLLFHTPIAPPTQVNTMAVQLNKGPGRTTRMQLYEKKGKVRLTIASPNPEKGKPKSKRYDLTGRLVRRLLSD